MIEPATESKPPDSDRSPEPLTERIADWRPTGEAIDAAARVVRGVALCGTTSRNGYAYPEAVLRAAAPLYEGAPVFLDHAPAAPTGRPADRGRSARDYVGSVRAVRFEEGRLRGDVAALDTDAGRTFLALAAGDAAGAAPRVGMSHVVLAERTADGSAVTAIREVLSVDAVAFPATVSRLRESLSPKSGDNTGDTDSQQLREELAEAQAEVARLRRERTAQAAADAAIEEVGLPGWAATPTFRRALAAAATDAERRALAEDRVAVLERLRIVRPPDDPSADVWPRGPVSRSRPAATGPDRGALLVRAVRGA
ncbi:hypothetical protein [Alienimonas californiensis]|uniref:Uncharacterized protein n=1 Tax=Alienimonas californiensis TaxID=2527989 RepID=A0A517P703_9PLAN|nr:hypothetical protein [Alienimonas californiensis]QDT15132.1 hypothetical protein CA12_12130 [Alienimonas californiensis]